MKVSKRTAESRMSFIDRAIDNRTARIGRDWLKVGRYINEVFQNDLWEAGAWGSFEAWLESKHISKSWGYSVKDIAASPHVELLAQLPISTARIAVESIKGLSPDAAVERIEEIAAQPTWTTARQVAHPDPPDIAYHLNCPSCHAALIASRAVNLKAKRTNGSKP